MTQRLLLRNTEGGKTPEVEDVTAAGSSGKTAVLFLDCVLGGDEHDINKTMASPMPPHVITEDVRWRWRCIVYIFKRRLNLKLA
jgi:hypothetical protein